MNLMLQQLKQLNREDMVQLILKLAGDSALNVKNQTEGSMPRHTQTEDEDPTFRIGRMSK